jgi:hypothetical protein
MSAEGFSWIGDQRDVCQRIAVDQQKIGQRMER